MRLGAWRSKPKVAVLGVCALAGVAVISVLAGFAASGSFPWSGSRTALPPMPTTGDYAPITIPKPVFRFGVDPDSTSRQGQELQTSLMRSGPHRFQLTISNASSIGFINSFSWSPPPGMSVVKVTGSSAGRCTLAGTPGYGGKQFSIVVLNPKISCDGLRLK